MDAPQTPVIMEKSKWGQSQDYPLHETKNSPLEQCVSDQTEPSQFVALQHQKIEISKAVVPPIELQAVNQDDEGLDLNKTPQQKPRRKKHRPKVIKEGKIAKIPKEASSQSIEKMTGKRKYVRKNKEDCPERTFGGQNVVEATTGKRKYVRKNKEDSPKGTFEGQNVVEVTPGKRKYIRKKKEDNQQHTPENMVPDNFCTNKSVKRSLNFDSDNTQENVSNTQSNESGEAFKNVISLDTPIVMHSSTDKIANENVRTPQTPSQPNELSRLDLMKRSWKEDFVDMVLNLKPTTEDDNSKRFDKEIDCTNIQKKIDEHLKVGQTDPKAKRNDHVHVDNDKDHTNISTAPCSHTIFKKRKIENDQHGITSNTFSTPCCTQNSQRNINSMRDCSKVFSFPGAQSSMPAENFFSSNYILVVNHVTKESSDIQVLSRNRASCPVYSFKQDTLDCSQPSFPKRLPVNESYGPEAYAGALVANQTKTKTPRRMKRKQDQLVRSREENAKMMELMIECIARKLTCLSINAMLEIYDVEPQNALVPFMCGGTMIPYTGPFETVKKKKPRAKVDLDDESQRVWNLLMGKESDGSEGTNVDKEKWWEEERRVFHGRTDSFIARMHLIQGDRRFSQWKGSVVDSVIGVFLTQNVSDHLSSSAFMSLASKFPFESKSSNTPIFTETNSYDQNLPPVYESNQPNNSEIPNSNENSFSERGSGHESPDSVLGPIITSCVAVIEGEGNKIPSTEDVVSSQNSTTPYVNKHTSFTELLRMANNRALHATNITGNKSMFSREYGDEIDWLGLLRVNDSRIMLNESNTSSFLLSSPESNKTMGCSNDSDVLTSEIMVQQLSSSGSETKCFQSQTISIVNATTDTHGQTCSSSQKEADLKNSAESFKNDDSTSKEVKSVAEKAGEYDWDSLRKEVFENGFSKARGCNDMDSLDYKALRNAPVSEISNAIRERGMNNKLAERIKNFLDRLVRDHGSVDLEWLRHVSPDKAKDYLLSIRGLGLKSVECVRLLTLHQLAFPVDTNVARISVRLGWVPLQPLPESVQIHLLEMYPVMETIQKYLWPRLCKLDQQKLYELHYQLITFGKVFCTKSKPNCNSCPMRGECKHFASAYASARLALPAPDEKRIVTTEQRNAPAANALPLPQLMEPAHTQENNTSNPRNYEPIIEEPSTPEPESIETTIMDIEDAFYNDPDEIPTIQLNLEEFTQNLQKYMHENNIQLEEGILSNALVAVSPDAAKIPVPKLKNVNRLRTEHQVYELPDGHSLLERMDKREPDDPSPYLLAIWTAGETAQSIEAPKSCCNSQDTDKLCDMVTCFSCNSIREAQSQTVRGTILIPCRTANRGSFPLNGTYFQVNEVFADHDSSRAPIDVPRKLIWNLNRRTVYFGTSIPSIFKGLTTEGIQHCFWRGFVCVRGFDRATRAPRPLFARLHFPVSKLTKTKKTGTATKTTTKEEFVKSETTVTTAEAEKTKAAISAEMAEQNTSVQESFQGNSKGSTSPQINLNDLPVD